MSGSEIPMAFPQSPLFDGPYGGMTLRDWFAGKALTSGLVDTTYPEWQLKAWFGASAFGLTREQIAAKASYALADAMLVERSRTPKPWPL